MKKTLIVLVTALLLAIPASAGPIHTLKKVLHFASRHEVWIQAATMLAVSAADIKTTESCLNRFYPLCQERNDWVIGNRPTGQALWTRETLGAVAPLTALSWGIHHYGAKSDHPATQHLSWIGAIIWDTAGLIIAHDNRELTKQIERGRH